MDRREIAAEVVRALLVEERPTGDSDPLREQVRHLIELLERQGIPTRLLSVNQFVERHPGIPVATLRRYLLRRETNGLAEAGAVIKFEGRVLIDEYRMLEALRRGSQRPGVHKPRRGRPRAA